MNDVKELLSLLDVKENRLVDLVFAKDGLLDKAFENYAVRDGQTQMAKACLSAFLNSSLLIAEAGTGTGKTFAYLIPALLLNDKKIVISTGSKALQDQIVKHDIPRILKILNQKRSYCVLKGLSNYLCLKKYEEHINDLTVTPKQRETIQNIVNGAMNDANSANLKGSFGDLSQIASHELSSLFSCGTHQCSGKKCEYFQKECFAYKARRRAIASDIVVINHALFFSSLQVDDHAESNRNLLPKYDVLIFDEAHSLSEIGRNFYAQSFSTFACLEAGKEFLSSVEKDLPILTSIFEKLFKDLANSIKNMHNYLKDHVSGSVSLTVLKYVNYDPKSTSIPKLNMEFRQLTIGIFEALKAIKGAILKYQQENSDLFEQIQVLIDDQLEALVKAMVTDRDKKLNKINSNDVAYLEMYKKGFVISKAPIYIGKIFYNDLVRLMHDFGVGIVMTSATVSVNKDVSKFIFDTLGDQCEAYTMVVDSIFDYYNHSLLYIDNSFPSPKAENREEIIIKSLKEVIDTVNGGIFFLTTSNKALSNAYLCFNKFFSQKRKIFMQGGNLSNIQIMQKFKNDGRAILIGTSSFWEGVDVPGKALSLVIIDKLPFINPDDPIYQAKKEKIEERYGVDKSFFLVSMPEAIISLRQGVGRLIRNENDKGALIICDPRIVSMHYGKSFISALPAMKHCNSKQELLEFFKKLE